MLMPAAVAFTTGVSFVRFERLTPIERIVGAVEGRPGREQRPTGDAPTSRAA
jgi:hypothetical protein